MKEFVVQGDVLQAILNYLAGRPYAEVFELVKNIQSTSKVLEPRKASLPTEATSTTENQVASA